MVKIYLVIGSLMQKHLICVHFLNLQSWTKLLRKIRKSIQPKKHISPQISCKALGSLL